MSLTEKALFAFLTPILLGFFSWIANLLVQSQLGKVHLRILDEATEAKSFDPKSNRTMGLAPESLGGLATWASDALQIPSSALGPILGLLLLHDEISTWLNTLLIVSVVLILAAFVGFVMLGDPRNHQGRYRRLERRTLPGVTPVLLGLAMFNAGLGLVTVLAVN